MGKVLRNYNFDIGISLDSHERVTLMEWFAHIPIRISMEQALVWKLGWESGFILLIYHFQMAGIIVNIECQKVFDI